MADHHAFSPTFNYAFPPLNNQELLQCMSEMGVDLRENELKEPHRHKERIREILLKLLTECSGLSEDDFSSAHLITSNEKKLNVPELHKDSLSDILLFCKFRDLMETCGLQDFGMRDIVNPSAKRFKQELCAAINMVKLREQKMKIYTEAVARRLLIIQELERAENENVAANEDLEAKKITAGAKYERQHQLEEENAHLELEIMQTNKLQTEKRKGCSVLKKSSDDLRHEIESASLVLEELQADEAKLLPKVVSSPDRRKNELNHKKELLDRERNDFSVVEEKLENTKRRINNVTKAEQDCQLATTIAKELKENYQEYSQVMEQVRNTEKAVEDVLSEKSAVSVQKEEYQRTVRRTEEKIVRSRKQSTMEIDAVQAKLEMARHQLSGVEQDHKDRLERIQAGKEEVRVLENALEEEKQRNNSEIANVVAEYRTAAEVILDKDADIMNKKLDIQV